MTEPNDLTTREWCNLYCAPGGRLGYGYDDAGEVFRCEHGVVRRCPASTGWGYWSQRRNRWERLSPTLNPVRYRRALDAIAKAADAT